MKHHALLGLILGLLATARLGGQVLFEVSFNPDFGKLTITSTGASPTTLTGVDPALNTNQDGITLSNLFKTNFDGGSTILSEISSLSASINGQAVQFGYGSLAFEIAPGNATIPGITNNGRHLAIFSDTTDSRYFSAGPLVFNANGSLTLDVGVGYVPPIFVLGEVGYVGPTNVYVGSYVPGGFSTYSASTLIGTYNFTVVPEPSTYAAIAGGIGLLAAVLHRRRQRAHATAA